MFSISLESCEVKENASMCQAIVDERVCKVFVQNRCISYTFDTKCNIRFSVLQSHKLTPRLCFQAVSTRLFHNTKKMKCDISTTGFRLSVLPTFLTDVSAIFLCRSGA